MLVHGDMNLKSTIPATKYTPQIHGFGAFGACAEVPIPQRKGLETKCFPSYLESVVSKGGLPLPAVRLIFQQCAQEFCTGFKFWVDLGLWLILFYWLGVGSQGFRFRRVSRLWYCRSGGCELKFTSRELPVC